MAVRFYWEDTYDTDSWIVEYPNASGYQEKFLEMCKQYVMKSDFPNIDLEIEQYKTGGWVFNKEFTPMLGISFKKSQFSKLGVFFRAQQFGNIVYYTVMKTVDRGFWDAVAGRSKQEIRANIRKKCKNLAQWEELWTLDCLGSLIFGVAMKALDPNYQENKQLFSFTEGGEKGQGINMAA